LILHFIQCIQFHAGQTQFHVQFHTRFHSVPREEEKMIKYVSSVEVIVHRAGVKVGTSGLVIKVIENDTLIGEQEPVFSGSLNDAAALRDALNDALTRARQIGEL
jgi:hypothetical protein